MTNLQAMKAKLEQKVATTITQSVEQNTTVQETNAPKVTISPRKQDKFWFKDEEAFPTLEEVSIRILHIEDNKEFEQYNMMFAKFNHTGLLTARVSHPHFHGEFPITYNNAEGTLSVWSQQRFFTLDSGEVRSKSSFEPTAIIKANVLREAMNYLEF